VVWVLGIVPVGFVVTFLAAARMAAHEEPRADCANNMRQIGLAIAMYCHDNHQQFPSDLATLIPTENLSPKVFVCGQSSDTQAPQAAKLLSGGHCSYVYVGAGMTDAPGAGDVVVAFELPGHHASRSGGGNILYADGHVMWIELEQLVQLVPELEAGHNPPVIVPLSTAQAQTLYSTRWLPKLASICSGTWAAKLPRPTPPQPSAAAPVDTAPAPAPAGPPAP
jgi:prepilin-type processing-associated H-X9-DG protein